MKRRHFLLLASSTAIVGLGGCTWFNGLTMRSQSPDELVPEEPQVRLVGDITVPTNMHWVRVDAVGLVTGLHGTGSDPGPSAYRDQLLQEMQTRGVANPNTLLATGDVSLVVVQGLLRPGIHKGDRFDMEIRVPARSETTSLRGGYLLETRLAESMMRDNQQHRGSLLALAQGPVMIDPTADPKKDRVAACRGRILGGGVAGKSRPLGLVLTSSHHKDNMIEGDESKAVKEEKIRTRFHDTVLNSQVTTAINTRFHTFQNGVKSTVAKAVDDQYIELQVHPRYKDNITRYMNVILAVGLSESAPQRMNRIASLASNLLDPATAADAAIQLEAIGVEGVDPLLKGIASKDPEVRFYSAEALAFLDRREAAEPLGQIARDQPAFRVFALAALSAMQEYAAGDQLRALLSSPSAETRYGAFRSLWANNPRHSLVCGESLGGQFNYHVLDVGGPAMIHVTRSRLSEIVIFGPGQQLLTPLALNAGNAIMVTSSGGGEIVVGKYSAKDGDQKRTVPARVDDVIRAIVELGGTYPDVVQALQEAKNSGALQARFEIDALPEAGRTYERIADGEPTDEPSKEVGDSGQQEAKPIAPARPLPELFASKGGADSSVDGKSDAKPNKKRPDEDDSDEDGNTKKGFFARMLGR